MQYSACESKSYVEIRLCVLVFYTCNIVDISRWNMWAFKIDMAVGRLFHIYVLALIYQY